MPLIDPHVARLAAAQHGIVSRSQLRAAGLTDEQIDGRVADRLLRPVHHGVYRHAAVRASPAGRALAACLACGPSAVASHRSAARLWELRDVPRTRPEVTVLDHVRARRPGVIVHQTDRLASVDVGMVDGVPVTAPARTLLDLGAVVPASVVEQAVHDAIILGLVSAEELACVLERLGGPGRRGTSALRAALWGKLPPEELQSRLEHALWKLIEGAGVPLPEAQHQAVVGGGRLVRFDFAWPDLRLAVEADGRRWHATRRDFERDLERCNAIASGGWRHYRYGWAAVHERPAVVRAEINCAVTLGAPALLAVDRP